MSTFFKFILFFSLLVLTSGCASEEILIAPPSESTLGKEYSTNIPALNKRTSLPDTSEYVSYQDTIHYEDALALSMLYNPRLQTFGWQVRIEEARRIQASIPPNPVVGAELENFGGSGQLEGFDNPEVTVSLSQKVLLGADRMKRKKLAELNKELAGWDYETARLSVLTGATQAFVSAVEEQRQLQVQQELVDVAQELYQTVSAQYKAGKVSKLQQVQAGVELSTAKVTLENARQRFESAKSNLASFWGAKAPDFQFLSGSIENVFSFPKFSQIRGYISRNPVVARWTTEIQQRKATLSLEKAKGIPNVDIMGAYRRIGVLGEHAFVTGFSIPLPVFDRNQGNVKSAEYQLKQVESQQQAAITETLRSLQETYNTLQASYSEVIRIREEIMPGARTAFEAAQTGYRQGKFDYLEVLVAQRTFFATQTRYIQALGQFQRTVAEIEQLIGTPLSEIASN